MLFRCDHRDHFKNFSAWPTHSGLSDFAKWTDTGAEVPRDRLDFPWCLVLQPLLQPDGSDLTADTSLEQDVQAKVQGSAFKQMWAVLSRSEGTLRTYASQADAAAAAAICAVNEQEGSRGHVCAPKPALPVVHLHRATKVELPQKYVGQHIIGLQPLQSSAAVDDNAGTQSKEKLTSKPLFFRFTTAEDCERWSSLITEISADDTVASSGDIRDNDHDIDEKAPSCRPSHVAASVDKAEDNEPPPTFLHQLSRIRQGTALYHIFACPTPECATRMMQTQKSTAVAAVAETGSETRERPFLLKVGVLRSASRFVRSSHRLAFRHQRKEEDYARKPQWKDQLDRGGGVHLKIGHKAFEANIRAGRYAELS